MRDTSTLTLIFPRKVLAASTLTLMLLLTKLQRNMLYEAIAEIGLDPAQCRLETVEDILAIEHNSGSRFAAVLITPESRFKIRARDPIFRIRATVVDGSDRLQEVKDDLTELLPLIRTWADEVKQVVETPDYWRDIKRSREFIADTQGKESENTPFTQREQEQIAAQLQAITRLVAEKFELSAEQAEQIEERLDQAAEASKHMGRKDWFIYLLGTITALLITATVTAGVGEHIFSMVIQGIAHLFTGGSEPPKILA